MKFALNIYETGEDFASRSNEQAQTYWAAWGAFAQALHEAGVSTGGAALLPPATATTIRLRDGKRQIQDGPYADSREQLGGFFLLEVPSIDEALSWAEKAPCTSTGGVEVRPVLETGAPR